MKLKFYMLLWSVCGLFATATLMAQTPVAHYAFSGNAKDQSSFTNHASALP
ncbi:MAG: hypothetical protein L6Q97_13025 [Thermoanaerobaculia bacterium]|nr:hypothetical protein [Thermoanaerobaculia bacterium]